MIENEIKNNALNDSLNKLDENIIISNEEKEINEKSNDKNYNSDNNELIQYNIKNNLKNLNKNYTVHYNTDDISKKINNKKINNTLNDIYDSIATINEANKRVKNILSSRYLVNKSSNIKRKLIREDKNFTSDNNNNINNKNELIKDFNYYPNIFNIQPKTTKNYSLYNMNNVNDKNSKRYDISSTFRT